MNKILSIIVLTIMLSISFINPNNSMGNEVYERITFFSNYETTANTFNTNDVYEYVPQSNIVIVPYHSAYQVSGHFGYGWR